MADYKFYVILFLICSNTFCQSQRTFLDNVVSIRILRAVKEWLFDTIGSSGATDGPLFREAQRIQHVQEPIPEDVPFPCNISAGRSKVIPSSVHKLRPGDIDVIGAMGDSLTAGFGIFASSLFNMFIENRGASALGGGQGTWRQFFTIPNILKVFNPNLLGYASADSNTHQLKSEFNVAESAAMVRDMPFMAENLINRMRSDPRVNMQKHWKLVSIFIGANDLCTDMCWNPSAWATIDNLRVDLMTTLRTLRDNLPRTLVSVVPPPNLRFLVEMKGRSELCQLTVETECSCLFGLHWRDRREEFYDIINRFLELQEEIAAYPEFQLQDFAVVVQPAFTSVTWPTSSNGLADFRYMSADCFHLSQLGNARLAYTIWKNMLEPAWNKTRTLVELGTLNCPSKERPYISTLLNS